MFSLELIGWQARKLKDAILVVPTYDATDDFLQQVKNAQATLLSAAQRNYEDFLSCLVVSFWQLRYLHETIDPDGMCFGGGGFFALKNSLLVSVSAAM